MGRTGGTPVAVAVKREVEVGDGTGTAMVEEVETIVLREVLNAVVEDSVIVNVWVMTVVMARDGSMAPTRR